MRIFAFAFMTLLACAFAAEKNDFSITEADKKLIAPGESINLKIKIENMEGYKAKAWYVMFKKPDVPEGAAEALGKKYTGKNPAWSYARIYEAWFNKDTLDQTERTLTLKMLRTGKARIDDDGGDIRSFLRPQPQDGGLAPS